MFNIKIPTKARFKQHRGRPIKQESVGPTPELQQKQRRIRDILKDIKSKSTLSWLQIAYHADIINQELLKLGEDYLRLRTRVLRHQQCRRLRLSCDTLAMPNSYHFSKNREDDDAKAEETWRCLVKNMPPRTLNNLDELLLETIDYDLTPEQAMITKLRLRRYLIILNQCKDILE